MSKIKIVVDKDIPYISEFIDELFEAHYYPGEKITNREVKDAEVIIIRTITKCNIDLLNGSRVKLIITATIGDDHIDKRYCRKNNIEIRTAEGCNSNAVVQYVIMSLFFLGDTFEYPWQEKTMGIIGVGNIGSRLDQKLKCLGVKTLLYDPPRKEKENKNEFVSLEEIRTKADIISIHTPLTKEGIHKTKHLLKDSFFSSISKKIVLINSSRGAVLSTETLLKWKKAGIIEHLIIDVWENEPSINKDLLNLSSLSTPHIAGYSLRGKITATYMSIQQLNDFYKINNTKINSIFSKLPKVRLNYNYNPLISIEKNIWNTLIQIWDINKDQENLRSEPLFFSNLRANYTLRNDFSDVNINVSKANTNFLSKLKCIFS